MDEDVEVGPTVPCTNCPPGEDSEPFPGSIAVWERSQDLLSLCWPSSVCQWRHLQRVVLA